MCSFISYASTCIREVYAKISFCRWGICVLHCCKRLRINLEDHEKPSNDYCNNDFLGRGPLRYDYFLVI